MQGLLLCSIDSFLASVGIGFIQQSEGSRTRLIAAFAMCDLFASLVGTSVHLEMTQGYRGGNLAALSASFLIVALAIMICSRGIRPSVFWIPLLLSLDNLLTGVVNGSANLEQFPLIAGLASGLLAWVGFGVSRVTKPLLSGRTAFVVSIGLIWFAFAL